MFLYAKEDEVYIQEVLEETPGILPFLKKQEQKKPIIMARVIHLEEMLKLVRSSQPKIMVIEVRDEILQNNTGIYRLEMTPYGSHVTKLKYGNGMDEYTNKEEGENLLKAAVYEENEHVVSMHISEMAPWILKRVFINEIV